MQAPQFDVIELTAKQERDKSLNLPYDRLTPELSDEPRLVRGSNSYVTTGGKLCKRPGTVSLALPITGGRIDRMEVIETLENPSRIFLIASVYDFGTSKWIVKVGRVGTGWSTIPALRSVNASTAAHEIVVVRGKAYIFGYPDSGDSEKIGAVVYDPVANTTVPWGISAPVNAAVMSGLSQTTTATPISATATSIPLASVSGMPAVPFTAQIGTEQVQVTGIQVPTTAVLSLAEVQVFGTGGSVSTNYSLTGTPTQSSTDFSAPATRANDGTTTGDFYAGSVTHTLPESNPWWQVDLGASHDLSKVTVWNRTDNVPERLSDFWVFASNTPFLNTDTPAILSVRAGTFAYHYVGANNATQTQWWQAFLGTTTPTAPYPNPSADIALGGYNARYVRVQLAGNSTTGVIATRGYNTTVPTTYPAGTTFSWRTWGTAPHAVTVRYGWKYKYAYKTASGQVSAASPLSAAVDTANSNTGPFTNLVPAVTLTDSPVGAGASKIVVYRTTDAGGQWWKLEEVNAGNTGGSVSYVDDSWSTGDPLPDTQLNTADAAVPTTGNNTPPRVIAPAVAEVDTPQNSTPFAYWQGRIWYGIGNVLIFSGNEEVVTGVPEESFFSGTTGNFMRFQQPIAKVVATDNGLYVFTTQAIHKIIGNNRETFNASPVFDNVGAAIGHKRAICSFANNVVFLTHDFRVAVLMNDQLRSISDPLGTDLVDAVNAGKEIEIRYWADMDKEWVIVSAVKTTDATACRQWVYDIKKTEAVKRDFWNTPWTIYSTCMLSSRVHENTAQRRLLFAMYDASTHATQVAYLDSTGATGTDVNANSGSTAFGFSVTSSLFTNPTGNHLNTLRAPAQATVLQWLQLERMVFSGDMDPQVTLYKDDIWTAPLEPKPGDDPYRRASSLGYRTELWSVNEACQRVAFELSKVANYERCEIQSIALGFTPDSGV